MILKLLLDTFDDMDNIYENIKQYNLDKEHKVLIEWIYEFLQKNLLQNYILF